MSRCHFMCAVLACTCAVLLFPDVACATTGESTQFAGLGTVTDQVQSLLFGTGMRFVGALGAFYGVIRSMFSNSLSPFLTFGGIGIFIVMIPQLLSGFFNVASVLLQ